MPGGFGTMDELFEALTLVATGKITKFPIVLVGRDYWSGLLTWLQDTMLARANIGPTEFSDQRGRPPRRGRRDHPRGPQGHGLGADPGCRRA